MIKEYASGKILDFSAVEIHQYSSHAQVIPYESVSLLLDDFYYQRDSAERMKQKSAGLMKLLRNHEAVSYTHLYSDSVSQRL